MSESNLQSQSDVDVQLQLNNVNVSQNEIKCNHTINRLLDILLKNDLNLYEDYKSIYSSIKIQDYVEGHKYDIGDLVWFQDPGTKKLYLLKCIRKYNNNGIRIIGDDPYQISQNLLAQGWKNENDYLNMVNMGITNILSSKIQSKIEDHQLDEYLHPFGRINNDPDSKDYIGNKLLYKNLCNLDSTRETNFFPNEVHKINGDNVIVNGYYREYDNKILEYDILFKFGSDDSSLPSNFGQTQTISANNVVLKNYSGIGGRDKYTNRQYFLNSAHQDIFYHENTEKVNYSKIGLLKQLNRNDFVNTYFAKISFPKNFANTNYSIFANTVMSQCYEDNVVPSQNEIVFCNKARGSVVAINVTYPNSSNYYETGMNTSKNGLISNSFHCKIIGIGE